MRGFRRAMPFTYGCFVIGGLALSGIPPFSGFPQPTMTWSRENTPGFGSSRNERTTSG